MKRVSEDLESKNQVNHFENEIILPIKKRNCTDKLFLVMIICSWFAMTLVGFCSLGIIKSSFIAEGNPELLIHGVDYMGNVCSIDSEVKSLPFKLMPNFFGTNYDSKKSLVPNLLAICVDKCPKEGDVVADPYGTYGTWTVEYDTSNFLNNCLYVNIQNIDNTSGSTVFSDFMTSYKEIAIFGFILSIIFSFLFLLIIRIPLLLRTIVWSCIFLILIILAAGGYLLLTKAKSDTTSSNDSYGINRTEVSVQVYVLCLCCSGIGLFRVTWKMH